MARQWTFRTKIAVGFAFTVLLAVVIAAVAVWTLQKVVASKDRVITVNAQILIDSEKLYVSIEQKGSAGRAYLLTGSDSYLTDMTAARDDFRSTADRLRREVRTDDERSRLDSIVLAEGEHQTAYDGVAALRRHVSEPAVISRAFDVKVVPEHDRLYAEIESFESEEQRLLDTARAAGTQTASSASHLVILIGSLAVMFAVLVAFLLTRTLGHQIGNAVAHVRSSSAELQSSANQQATSAKEQATAMSEITTTINELLVTARQIADSSQRVAHIADQTARAAGSGQGTVETAQELIGGIRRQVDLIVSHMLELGKKSQQIGSVLDIVSEVAEQTNILAINATIEAAGAGDAGKRFGVVADEIRKLADRVAGSTNEIRSLIDEVRSAVNTTVMATETGSKAVDAGSGQFQAVAASFKQISDQVTTTTEVAREIELSTKQQTTAVEQVNVAVANVAQATKETEVSLSQTLQTVSQLAMLSADLLRLVQAKDE
jgi:methyl-accepting chemotaxis protein